MGRLTLAAPKIVEVLAWRNVHLECLNCCFHLRFVTSVWRIMQVLAWFRFTKPRCLTCVSRIVQVAAWIRSTKARCLATVSRIVQVVAWIKSTKHLLTTISRIAHLDRPQLLIPPSILGNFFRGSCRFWLGGSCTLIVSTFASTLDF